jgi:hypothetical protein
MFVADQRGIIRIFRNGMLEPNAFLDLGPKLVAERSGYDERGLLGLAFHPGYANAGSPGFRRFYVFYIATSPAAPGTTANPVDSRAVLAEYKVSAGNADGADPASERVLLTFDKPQFNHAGGGLAFGPDGFLYFTVGDGGSSQDNNAGHTGGSSSKPTNAKGNAQDLTTFLGKMHRVDPLGTNGTGGQYGIPADNPFAGGANGARPEIFAYGFRNTWRFSFDSRPGGTNRLFAADVGQGEVEEIDLVTNGGNYGWRNKEGTFVPTFSTNAPAIAGPTIDPVAQYAHPGVVKGSPALPQYGISCTGGYVYRGSAIPSLVGKYVFADYSETFSAPRGVMLGLEETSPGMFSLQKLDILGGNPIGGYVQSFGQDEQGELYVLTRRTLPVSAPDPATGLPSGKIYKIVPVPPSVPLNLAAAKDNTIFEESSNSNGAGANLFAGATEVAGDGSLRRALLAFNLNTLPAGATVASAMLTLNVDLVPSSGAQLANFSFHRMLSDWGEGTSSDKGEGAPASANDATWLKPFFGQPALWLEPGGDFDFRKSATASLASTGSYSWSAPQLAYDINDWLAAPATNFGWLLKVDVEGTVKTATGNAGENTIVVSDTSRLVEGMRVKDQFPFAIGSGAQIAPGGINATTGVVTLTVANTQSLNKLLFFEVGSAKRFSSRTALSTTVRPRLAVNYVPAPVLTRRGAWEKQHFFVGEYISDAGDSENDGLTNGIEYAWGFSPKARNQMSDGLTVDGAGLASGAPLTVVFRRDPLATDLTYELQGTSDLVTWITLAQSVAGATPTGVGFQSEAEIAGQAPFRNVVVRDNSPAGSKRFFRLKVTR